MQIEQTSRNTPTQDIILQIQSSVEDFSFCKDFKTPNETVPATNKKTVGVKDGYKYLTKKSSHASGRKPEAARAMPSIRTIAPRPNQASKKALSFFVSSSTLPACFGDAKLGFSTGSRRIMSLFPFSCCFLAGTSAEAEAEEPNPLPDDEFPEFLEDGFEVSSSVEESC